MSWSIGDRVHLMVDRSDDRRTSFRRIEVLADAGRRRSWSDAEKVSIVLESFEDGAVVAGIARRRGIRAQQIHGWRREAREGRLVLPAEDARALRLAFAPVVVDDSLSPPSPRRGAPPAPPSALPPLAPSLGTAPRLSSSAPIEIEGAGVIVRIGAGADAMLAASLLRVMKERR